MTAIEKLRKPDPLSAVVFDIEGYPIPVAKLACRAHNSDFGQVMNDQPLRFSEDFGYDRALMLKDLGPDVHPIGHQNETARHLAALLDSLPHGLTDEQVGIIMLKERLHDMGESMHDRLGVTVGDIPAGKKTEEQRLHEQRIRLFIFNELYPDIPKETLNRIDSLIMHKPQPGDEYLYELGEIAHKISSFETARKAIEVWCEYTSYHQGEIMTIGTNDDGRRTAVLGIHRAVFLKQGLDLYNNYRDFSYVAEIIGPYTSQLQAFASLPVNCS